MISATLITVLLVIPATTPLAPLLAIEIDNTFAVIATSDTFCTLSSSSQVPNDPLTCNTVPESDTTIPFAPDTEPLTTSPALNVPAF